jgi:hypothetical protein
LFNRDRLGEPATHALVIGVGHYPHLGDSSQHPALRSMHSLSSPAFSGAAVARQLIQHADAGPKPLASLRLLLSPRPGQALGLPAEWNPPRATRAAIVQAATQWRAAASEHDRLVFYFCGHGLEAAPILLPEDFGALPGELMPQGISFQKTKDGMAGAKAREQVWFIDACRNNVLAPTEHDERGLFADQAATPADWATLKSCGLFAAKVGTQAFGAQGAPSYFCQALLEALNGGASAKEGDHWHVRADELLSAVSTLMRKEGRGSEVPTAMDGDANVVLRVLPGLPQVRVQVEAVPKPYAGRTTLKATADNETVPFDAPRQRVWRGHLAAGVWTLRADPKDGTTPDVAEKTTMVWPPMIQETIRWQS